jgi:hypothetical protein
MCKKLQWQYQNSMANTILKFYLKLTLQLTLNMIYYIISYGIKQILVGHFYIGNCICSI